MKQISLILLFLGVFLLPTTSIAEITGDACSPSDNNDSFSIDITTDYIGDLNNSEGETFYFTIEAAGTLTLTPVSPAGKIKIAYGTNFCPVTASDDTPLEIQVTEATDINVILYNSTNGNDNSAYTLTAEFIAAPLTITKTVLPVQVEEATENNVTYTIEITNNTDGNISDLTMTDNLPFLPGDILSIDPDGWICNMTDPPFITSNLECNLSTSESKSTTTMEILVQVNINNDIDNTASVEADSRVFTDTVTLGPVTSNGTVDLEILKFAEADIIPPGRDFTYVIFVVNHTQGKDAELVTVTDIFPDDENVTFVSYDRGSGWDCDIPNDPHPGTFDCRLDHSMGHEISFFTITAHTEAGDYNNTSVINTAIVSSPVSPISGNHLTTATAEIAIYDVNLTGGGVLGGIYAKNGPVEVSDVGLALADNRSDAFIHTKVASTTNETLGTYIINALETVDTFSNVTTLDDGNNKIVPLTVIHKLGDKDCRLLTDPHLTYNSDNKVIAIFEGPDFSAPATESPVSIAGQFNLRNIAIKEAHIIMQYIDINAKLDDANETCRVSSVDGGIKGLPQCLTNSASSNKFDNNKYINTFGIEAFVRCAIQNGQPCSSANGGYGDDPYDSEYGCYECTLGSSGSCSKDAFAIRPKVFDVNITAGTIFKAGEGNDLVFKGLTSIADEATLDYNETQIPPETLLSVLPVPGLEESETFSVDANLSDSTDCEVPYLTLDPSVEFADGLHTGLFSFNDIGDINFSIHETVGTEFAIVDENDTGITIAQRLIEDFNITFRVIPHHFDLNVKLFDHNEISNFTYLHDFNVSEDHFAMGVTLNVDINASREDNNVTRNYTEGCYAKDTNLTLGIAPFSITPTGAITTFLYYNPVEEVEYQETLPSPQNVTSADIPLTNQEPSFPSGDDNGTTSIEYRLNFDRKQESVVNPFKMVVNDVNITDADNVKGTTIANETVTYYYAKARASKFFYEDIREDNVNTPIIINIYCDIDTTVCTDYGIDTISDATDERKWYVSRDHNHANNDGNVTLMVDATLIEGTGEPTINGQANPDTTDNNRIINWTNGVDATVVVDRNGSSVPVTVPIELILEPDTIAPETYTNVWLIHNEDEPILIPTPFYKVRFIGDAEWTGEGKTGYVVDMNASYIKSKRLDW